MTVIAIGSIAVNIILYAVAHKRGETIDDLTAERDGWCDLAATWKKQAKEATDRAELAEAFIIDGLMKEADKLTGGQS